MQTMEIGSSEEIWEAAKQLENISNEICSSSLHLLESRSTDSRAAAAYVLGFCRYASARSVLENVLENETEKPSVRGHAAEALAYIGDPRSVAVLLRQLEHKDVVIRYWSAFALGQIGDSRAIAALRRMAARSGEEMYGQYSLRTEALDAIQKIKHASSIGRRKRGDGLKSGKHGDRKV